MSQGQHRRIWRPLAVWAAVSAAAATGGVSVPAAWQDAAAGTDVPAVLVAVCATALAASLAWLWVLTTVTVAGLLGGWGEHGQAGAARRLVLLACGAAVAAGSSVPAHAAGGEGTELLAGLRLPDRAVAAAHHEPRRPTPPPSAYVVRPGDSLWSIARDHPGPGTSVDERWRAIWRANHGVVGDDPDLIVPGQALRLPAPTPPTDGDRC